MVDFAGFGDFLRNVIKDIEGGAGEIVRPVQKVGQDLSGALSGLRENVGDIGSTVRKDFGSLGDFLRSHRLGLAIGAGVGLGAGLGAYELLKSRNQASGGYNSQLSGAYNSQVSGTGAGGAGAYSTAGAECDTTCGQIPELPPCPQCSASGLVGGQISGQGGGGGSIFSDPLVWLIIAVVLMIIIVGIIMYYHKKKKKG